MGGDMMRLSLTVLALLVGVTAASAQDTKANSCTVAKCIVNQTSNRVDPKTGKHYTEAQARNWCPSHLSKSTACN